MNRSFRTLALVACAFVLPLRAAEPATASYRGVVTQVSGAQTGALIPGQSIQIDYVVDPAAPDADPSPGAGVFFNGLIRLHVSLPQSGLDLLVGPGTVQTFNDDPQPSDQVFFYSNDGAVVSPASLAGHAITRAEVDFIDSDASAGMPTMLASDAIPTGALLSDQSFAILQTDLGNTYVTFVAEEVPGVEDVVASTLGYLDGLVASGNLSAGVARGLSAKLRTLRADFIAGRLVEACRDLRDFENQVRNMPTIQIGVPQAAELLAKAALLRSALGVC